MKRLFAPVIALAVASSGHALSAEMRLSLENEQPRILLTGSVEVGDAAKLQALINRAMIGRDAYKTGLVALNSDGGEFLEGMELGMVLRKNGWGARVLSSHSCLSSCALAFLGGTVHNNPGGWGPDRAIRAGAKLGFHAFFSKSDEPIPARVGTDVGRFAANLLFAYFTQLGIEPKFAIAALEKGPQELLMVNTPALLKALGIVLIDLPADYDTHMTNEAAVNVCTSVVGWDPVKDAWTGTPQAEEITTDRFRRKLLQRLLDPLNSASRFKSGHITAAITEGATASKSEDLRSAYSEAELFDMVPSDPKDGKIWMVSGLEHIRHFKSRLCYVLVHRDGQTDMSARAVATPIDGFGRFEEIYLTRHGGIVFEMHRPSERLW